MSLPRIHDAATSSLLPHQRQLQAHLTAAPPAATMWDPQTAAAWQQQLAWHYQQQQQQTYIDSLAYARPPLPASSLHSPPTVSRPRPAADTALRHQLQDAAHRIEQNYAQRGHHAGRPAAFSSISVSNLRKTYLSLPAASPIGGALEGGGGACARRARPRHTEHVVDADEEAVQLRRLQTLQQQDNLRWANRQHAHTLPSPPPPPPVQGVSARRSHNDRAATMSRTRMVAPSTAAPTTVTPINQRTKPRVSKDTRASPVGPTAPSSAVTESDVRPVPYPSPPAATLTNARGRKQRELVPKHAEVPPSPVVVAPVRSIDAPSSDRRSAKAKQPQPAPPPPTQIEPIRAKHTRDIAPTLSQSSSLPTSSSPPSQDDATAADPSRPDSPRSPSPLTQVDTSGKLEVLTPLALLEPALPEPASPTEFRPSSVDASMSHSMAVGDESNESIASLTDQEELRDSSPTAPQTRDEPQLADAVNVNEDDDDGAPFAKLPSQEGISETPVDVDRPIAPPDQSDQPDQTPSEDDWHTVRHELVDFFATTQLLSRSDDADDDRTLIDDDHLDSFMVQAGIELSADHPRDALARVHSLCARLESRGLVYSSRDDLASALSVEGSSLPVSEEDIARVIGYLGSESCSLFSHDAEVEIEVRVEDIVRMVRACGATEFTIGALQRLEVEQRRVESFAHLLPAVEETEHTIRTQAAEMSNYFQQHTDVMHALLGPPPRPIPTLDECRELAYLGLTSPTIFSQLHQLAHQPEPHRFASLADLAVDLAMHRAESHAALAAALSSAEFAAVGSHPSDTAAKYAHDLDLLLAAADGQVDNIVDAIREIVAAGRRFATVEDAAEALTAGRGRLDL